jgi:hypothetical protein
MCTLYSITTNQDAVRALFRVTQDSAGNLPAMPAVFPDWEAPVARNDESGHELIKMRWGLSELAAVWRHQHQHPQPDIAALAALDQTRETAASCPRPASRNTMTGRTRNLLESVRRLQAGLQSFLSMRRIEARRKKAKAFRLRHSQSLASLRQRLSQAMVRSTIQRLGKTTNPLT